MAYILHSLAVCLCLHAIGAQFGFPSFNREERRFGNQFSANNFQLVPSRVTSILHLQPEGPNHSSEFVYPFNRPNDYRDQSQYYANNQQYGSRPDYQYDRYPYNNYPNPNSRPRWSQTQQNTARDPYVVVKDVTEAQQNREEHSFGDRYDQDTTRGPEVTTTQKIEELKEYNGGRKPGIPSLPPGVLGPDSGLPLTTLPPLTPVPSTATRSNFNFGTQGLFQETCDTPDGEVGSCVSLIECDPYLNQLKMARANPQIVQKLRRAHCGFEGDNPKVCCPRRGIPTNTPPPPLQEPQTTTPAPPVKPTNSELQTESPAELPSDDQYVDALPQPPVCGSSNASFSRVVGGIPAKLGDFPWMALLGYRHERKRDRVQFLCGGAIITHKHVLTAAHCYHTGFNKLTLVRLGELDLNSDDDGATPIDINIKRVIEHDEYNATAFYNDIAILLLEQIIPFTDLIKPICLPNSLELRSLTFEKYTPLIAGWGEIQWHGERSNVLQVVQLPVTSNAYCKKAFEAYKAQTIDESVLCAGYEKGVKDACRGDSGGPLMQPIWNSVNYTTYFYQIGVVSFGKKCAEPGFPGVYTRITAFMPWIEKTVLGHSS